MAGQMICKACGTIATDPKIKNTWLTLCVGVVGGFLAAEYFTYIPKPWIYGAVAVGTLIGIGNQRSQCPKCLSKDCVPVDSPIGRELAAKSETFVPSSETVSLNMGLSQKLTGRQIVLFLLFGISLFVATLAYKYYEGIEASKSTPTVSGSVSR